MTNSFAKRTKVTTAHRRPINWAPESAVDLSDIWEYDARAAGPPTANAVVGKIRDVCRVLDEHPLTGRARDEIRPGLRCMVASPHIIFYHVIDDATDIVRILGGRREIDDIFAETPKDE